MDKRKKEGKGKGERGEKNLTEEELVKDRKFPGACLGGNGPGWHGEK